MFTAYTSRIYNRFPNFRLVHLKQLQARFGSSSDNETNMESLRSTPINNNRKITELPKYMTKGSELHQLYFSATEKTFEFDKNLPSLPVPPLNDTIRRYLDSVRPVVTEEEYKKTEKIVNDFRDGIGQQLHSKLVEKGRLEKNWLQKWWEDIAYLSQRTPILPLSNVSSRICMPPDIWPPLEGSQCQRAAITLYAVLQYWSLIRKQQLRPDHNKTKYWSMQQWSRLFNTTRFPGLHQDSLQFAFKTEDEGECPSHVIVLCNGYIYCLQAVDSNHEIVNTCDLHHQLTKIRDSVANMSPGPGLGALTCDNRTQWHKNREYLISLHLKNKDFLELIDTAICVMVLDQTRPVTPEEVLHEGLGGDTRNRWADKSLSLIVHPDGIISFNGDHSPADAMMLVSMKLFIYLYLQTTGGELLADDFPRDHLSAQLLDIQTDDTIHQAVINAVNASHPLIKDISCLLPRFQLYGKEFMKHYKCHPDAVVQMALQLAYYRLHSRPAPTYETATTRQFFNGRTETVRSCTEESLRWTRAMLDSNVDMKKRKQLFDAAIMKHMKMMMDCQNGQGCDRHLLGLYILAVEQGLPVPEIFTDPSWVKSGGSGNFILSTSLTGYTPIHGGGAVPMCQDGYGVFYNIQEGCILFTLQTWKSSQITNGQRMADSISLSLTDIKEMLMKSSL